MRFALPESVFPPLAEELLKKRNFFELYPLDGGGNFVMQELFGTLDDFEITAHLPEVMAQFGGLSSPDFRRFERWRSIEKSCWCSRCYFLIPLARVAWLRHDAALARTAAEVILHFHRSCPPPSDLKAHWARVFRRMNEDYNGKSREEILKDETDVEYIWYDFQPGQRLISFLYVLYFIREFDVFTPGECAEVRDCLERHVRVLYHQELESDPLPNNNHQSVRVLALYWGAPLLEQDPEGKAVKVLAMERCLYGGLHLFLASGLEFENSPSYHAFVLWHLRDFRLLALRRGETLPAEYEAVIRAAAKVLAVLCRPDGKLLTINDSYQCDAAALLDSMGRQLDGAADFAVIHPGGIAAGRAGKCYAAMDASACPEGISHAHGGKNAPTILWDGVPFIDDAGCPNYDAPQFPKCKRSEWHSSLLVDGQGDARQYSLYGFDRWSSAAYVPEWIADEEGGHTFTSTLTSTVPVWQGVRWTRALTVKPDRVVIRDTVTSACGPHAYTLLFNLAPEVQLERRNDRQWRLCCGRKTGLLTVTPGEDVGAFAAAVGTLENCQQRQVRPVKQLQFTFTSCERLTCTVELQFTEDFQGSGPVETIRSKVLKNE